MMSGMKTFIEAYAKERAIPKTKAEEEVRAFLKTLKDQCVENDGVAVKGYFSLKKITKKGRTGTVNGHSYSTEDKKSLKLSIYSDLEDALQ